MDETDGRLHALFTTTDQKIKEFADFIKAVDNNNPILKQLKGNNSPVKEINPNVVKTIRDLSERGWGADEISKKPAKQFVPLKLKNYYPLKKLLTAVP